MHPIVNKPVNSDPSNIVVPQSDCELKTVSHNDIFNTTNSGKVMPVMVTLNDVTDGDISDATPCSSETNNLVTSILSVPTVNKPMVEVMFINDLMNLNNLNMSNSDVQSSE